jgi:hypothetical protein
LAASDIGNSVSQSKQIVNEMFFKNLGFQKICETADCFKRFALHFGPYACPKEQSTIFTNGRGLNFNRGLIGLRRMAEREVFAARRAGEIKASASALAGDFDFPPLTLWRARALPLCFDGDFIRVHWC